MVRLTAGVIVGLMAGVVHAQQTVVPTPLGQTGEQTSRTGRRIGDNHYIREGDVQIDLGDTKIFADKGEFFTDQNRVILTGNVVVSQANSRITADRAEFDTATKLGTFYNAWGMAPLGPQKTRATTALAPSPAPAGELFDAVSAAAQSIANQPLTAETDVIFFGAIIEKVGSKKFKITTGGFTTCVQPTPRWELHSSTVVLNIDEYTVLRNAVFRVKDVPLLYTPFLYYPTKREDRATGILLPTYGSTTLRGQSLHNAFFWAIDRSQDATFMHDWYSKTGQGLGGEYRYNFGAGSDGTLKTYWLNEHEATYALDDGTTSTARATRSYELHGSANQLLPDGFRARGRVNYFTTLTTMQTLHTNLLDSSPSQRSYGGNIVGVLNGFSINGTLDHVETFYPSSDSSAITGSWPRVAFSRNERPLFDSLLYLSVSNEYARTLNTTRVGSDDRDAGLMRLDTAPQIRYPLKRWAWFTANSTITFRDTYYTRSLDSASTVVDEGLNRRYVDLQTQLVGPVVARVFNTPDNGYAETFKHSVEPFLTIGRTTAIDNFDQIVKLDGTDGIVGGTRYGYGVSHRIYAKRRLPGTAVAQSREIVSVDLGQSYYTDQRAVQYDQQSSTGHSAPALSHFTPITLNARVVPSDVFTSNLHAEFDSRYHSLRTISATGTYTAASWVTSSLTWSKRGFIEQLPEFNDPALSNQFITGSANAHTTDNRYGGLYSLNYDVHNSRMLMQRLTGFYNAQCCGLAFEYQAYNLTGVPSAGVPMDHRFFMSFALAGLGNFSPFNGALSGAPR